jgi:tetratricopeptide (TPR) repeat protein
VLARAFAGMSELLRGHGGTVEKFIGDAVMAVFGVPATHDDDAERAVRAAFACRDEITRLNLTGRFALDLRIGVNTGEVVAGTGPSTHFLVTGTPVNLGARLQQAAVPGQILVGDLTRQLTRGSVRYGSPLEIDAKGPGRIEAFAAEALTSEIPEQHRGIEGHRAPLIGRDRELQLLRDAFARVIDTGTPSLVTVYGPAGAGKSRLISEFVDQVGRGQVRIGRCLPYGEGISLYAVQQLLRADLGIDPSDTHESAVRKLRDRVAVLFSESAERDAMLDRLGAIIGFANASDALTQAAPGDLAEELRWSVRRYLERRAASGALLLVFEDVHWGEPALLDLIEQTAEWSRAPLLIIALARPDFREVRPSWGSSVANALSVTLGPLPANDTRRLLAEILTVDALPERVRTELITRSEGNPLYVEEFLRMLIDAGHIGFRGGRWVAVSEPTALDVPPTLLGLIAARLDRVSPEVKRLLQHASLVGRLFSTAALAAIGGELPRIDLLREAVRRDLLLEADERAPGEGRVYRFKHVLIRDVAYGTIPKGERARMHDNYARWLDDTFGDRRDEFGDLIAYHAEQAFLLSKELGREAVPELGERALDWLLATATRARLRDDASALAMYERAINVADGFAASKAQRAEAYGFAAAARFRLKGDSERVSEALAICEESGPSEALVQVLHVAGSVKVENDRLADAAQMWDREVDVARMLGDKELVAQALMDRGRGAYQMGDAARSMQLLDDALDYMRSSSARRNLVACLIHCSGRTIETTGDFTRGREYLDEVVSELPPEHSRLMDANLHQAVSFYEFERGDMQAAKLAGELAVAAAREAGAPRAIGISSMHLGHALLELGDPQHARVVLEEGTVIMEGLRSRGALPELAARAALACVRLGDLPAARHFVDTGGGVIKAQDAESQMILGLARAELARAQGDPSAADSLFRKTIDRVQASPFVNRLAQLRRAYAEFLLGEARFEEAREHLRAARNFYYDPLARVARAQLDALLKQCEVKAV